MAITQTKPCAHCSKHFYGTKRAKYCSNSCKTKAYNLRKEKKECGLKTV